MGTAFILLDAQRNMLEGETPVVGADEVRRRLYDLLSAAREAGDVVVHVQNDGPPGSPDEPDTIGWELVFPVAEGEQVVGKDESDAFAANPGLASVLRHRGVDRVMIAGMQSDYCVRATCLGGLGEGFAVVLPSGAHATYHDGSSSATDIAATVEKELAEAGVEVVRG